MSLNREEIIKSKSYKVTRAALDWYKGNPNADVIDGFEAGWNASIQNLQGVFSKWKKESLFAKTLYGKYKGHFLEKGYYIDGETFERLFELLDKDK